MSEFRAGFVTFVGRPNVGKSTLTNALVGEKIAITSSKPQTTRKAIRGIVNTKNAQLIIVDTPGLHRPRTLLGQRLNDVVENTLGEVDVIGFCIPADEKIGPGDQFINASLDKYPRAKLVALVTKSEKVTRDVLASQLIAVDALRNWAAIVPVSAISGEQLEELKDVLGSLLPVSQALYPEDQKTEESLESRICELIREAALEESREELPHSLAVTIDEHGKREDSEIYDIHANLWVERDSQKPIIIGKGGSRLKEIGSQARKEIEALVGSKVMLKIHVKVAPAWQSDPKQLGRLGL
ncbi:MAG: GTPase Era [Micrococcales bacterium]|nr:GTPase Era [Micrococcales bacterium]